MKLMQQMPEYSLFLAVRLRVIGLELRPFLKGVPKKQINFPIGDLMGPESSYEERQLFGFLVYKVLYIHQSNSISCF